MLSCLCDWCTLKDMWTIGTCPTTIPLSAMSECVNECCIERPNERGIVLYEMADLYATQGVNLGGVAPPQEKWNDSMKKVA